MAAYQRIGAASPTRTSHIARLRCYLWHDKKHYFVLPYFRYPFHARPTWRKELEEGYSNLRDLEIGHGDFADRQWLADDNGVHIFDFGQSHVGTPQAREMAEGSMRRPLLKLDEAADQHRTCPPGGCCYLGAG